MKSLLNIILNFTLQMTLALTFCVQVYSQTPSQEEALKQARILVKKKEYAEAIRILKNANEPQNMIVLDELAQVSHLKKDYLEEVRALEIIKSISKMSPAQYVRLGNAYIEINKKDQVVMNFRAAIEVAPKFEKAYKGLYDFYLKDKNFTDARLIVIEIIEKFGPKKKWLNEYCRMEIEQSYFDNAKTICQEAILKDSEKADNHVYLSMAFKGTGNEDQARKILYQAAKQFLKSELTQWNAGMMSASLLNWELSNKHFSQCVEADKNSRRCHHELGKVKFKLKEYEAALDHLKKACDTVKDVDVEIRKYSYELNKIKKLELARKYEKEVDICKSNWFGNMKKISQGGR